MGQKKSKGGALVAALAMAAPIAPVVMNLVNKVVDRLAEEVINKIADKVEIDKADMVLIPSLYDEEFYLDLGQVTEMLEKLDLNVVPTEITFNKAHPKYRYFKENQVVGTSPKHKTYVKKGYPVVVKYVTAEVIAESQRIFDEAEKLRLEAKEDKRKKQEMRKEKILNIVKKK